MLSRIVVEGAPVAAAAAVSLQHVTDVGPCSPAFGASLHLGPGISRIKSGKQFRYIATKGTSVRDSGTVSRIRALAIPPAWTGVWIARNLGAERRRRHA